MERLKARRDALAHADAVTAGSVLRVSWHGSRVWVVWSGPTPIAVYPPAVGDPPEPVPVDQVVQHVDNDKRRTPAQVRDQTALARARRAARARLGRGPKAVGR